MSGVQAGRGLGRFISASSVPLWLIPLLALLLLGGCGPKEDYALALDLIKANNFARAAELLRPLALRGYAPAQYRLGVLYLTGKGVEADAAQAALLLVAAGRAGELGAQYTLGRAYRAGQGVTLDLAAARRWYGMAADHGFAPAQFMAAEMNERGEAGPVDMHTARLYYNRSAAQGYTPAIERLARAYERGELNLAPDPDEARRWREKLVFRAF